MTRGGHFAAMEEPELFTEDTAHGFGPFETERKSMGLTGPFR